MRVQMMSDLDDNVEVGTVPIQTPQTSEQHIVLLIIRGLVQRVVMEERITLGRKDNPNAIQPDFDMTPFGGVERGVSRVHAALEFRDGRLYLIDLGSTNGTYLNDEPLEQDTPTPLEQWNNVSLASLPMCILYK